MANYAQLTLLEALNTLKIADQHDHAHYQSTILQILRGQKKIGKDEAGRLAKVFPDTDADYWLGIQDDSDVRGG